MREISLCASLSTPQNRTHYFQLDVISNLVVIKWLLDGPSVWPIINMIIQSPLHYSVLYEMAVIQRECLDVCLGKGCRKLISSIQRGHNDSQQRVEHSKQLWGIADRVLIKALSLVKTSHTLHISLLKQATFKQTPTHVVLKLTLTSLKQSKCFVSHKLNNVTAGEITTY